MTEPTTIRNLELFLTREQIQQRVCQMGAEISRHSAGQPLLMIGVLKGATVFLADLARAISVDCTFDFLSISSYGEDMHSSGKVRLTKDIDQPIENRNVILVEDILDTGVTLRYLQNHLTAQLPVSLQIAALLDKPSQRLQPVHADYVGFTIPDRFVVGYGMDLAEQYRNLPDIYFVPSDIQE